MSPITALILFSAIMFASCVPTPKLRNICYLVARKKCCDACFNYCHVIKHERFCGSDCVAYCECKRRGLQFGSGNACLLGK
ncbi:hypothetical protein GDO81_014643 [Engystomops pustulosus]|uniref:TIL domain-containing protein n=1 Tax=Engystomops pustulosus TaxID=76066 RepID=A0AAV7BBN9_ENGPU|nr:hypothetical protein GDO81_014643 [Engystomops pustulosus]